MLRLSPLALFVVAFPVSAADVTLKPVYLQQVPHSQVLVDRRGKAWFVDKDGVRDAANKLACDATHGHLLLVDKAGRFWFHGAPKGKGYQLRYHDGTGWTDTGVESMEVHEDAAGRVIARTEFGFQVFDGKGWTEKKLFDHRVQAHGYYTDDAAGRVWCVLSRSSGGGGDHLWAFDGKAWTEHDPLKRAKDELYSDVVPLADDWFLISTFSTKPTPPAPRTWMLWSPTRTAEQVAKADKFTLLPRQGLTYTGTDLDGLRHFTRTPIHDGKRWLPEAWFTLTADGVVKELTAADATRLKDQPRTGQGWGQPAHIFATVTAPAPAIQFPRRGPIGRDADGRVYFPTSGRNLVGTMVLWPKHETPTTCLRPTTHTVGKYEKAHMPGLFADTDGTAFARHPQHLDGVLTWDGKTETWADTSIKPLPQTHWNHHVQAAPAEYGWANARAVGHATGTDGLSLFTRVKTKYVPERDGAAPRGLGVARDGPGGRANVSEEEPKVPDGPMYQYESWLHAGGKWSDPLPPADLIKVKRKELLAGFTQPVTPVGPLPVIAHAGRVWFAHEWKVSAMDANGVVHSAALPDPLTLPARSDGGIPGAIPRNFPNRAEPAAAKGTAVAPLMQAAFARKDDKTLVAVVSGGDPNQSSSSAYALHFQAGKLAGVKVSELKAVPVGVPTLHTAPDGTVLAWNPRAGAIYALTGDKWEPVAGTDRVLARTSDGAVWCEPALGEDADWNKGSTVMMRVSGAKAERFVWTPDELAIGFDKPPAGSAVFVLPQVGIGCLEPGKPGTKPTLRVRYTPTLRSVEFPADATVTASGHLLLSHEWVRLFDPAAKK